MYYAQINDEGIVKGVSDLAGEIINPNMIEIPVFDPSIMGKKWDGAHFIDSGIALPVPTIDPLMEKIDKLITEVAEIKADVKTIKDKKP